MVFDGLRRQRSSNPVRASVLPDQAAFLQSAEDGLTAPSEAFDRSQSSSKTDECQRDTGAGTRVSFPSQTRPVKSCLVRGHRARICAPIGASELRIYSLRTKLNQETNIATDGMSQFAHAFGGTHDPQLRSNRELSTNQRSAWRVDFELGESTVVRDTVNVPAAVADEG